MDDKQPLLSICIPTYNRQEQIQKQVRLLLPQLNELVELTVYDNFSDTPVEQLFTADELSKFTLIRNSTNVGGDANIARCFENCSRKWLWTLSDDDFVKCDAVSLILKEIENHADAIFLNFRSEKNVETSNFQDVKELFKSSSVYIFSFAMSFCVYNMHTLKPYLRFYYENLNSMVGTLILVLKYAERFPNSKLFFTTNSCIESFDSDVSWNYGKYITQSIMFINAFDPQRRKEYHRTLFRGYFNTNYILIELNRASSNITIYGQFKLLYQSIRLQGVLNVLKYNPKIVFRLYIILVLRTVGLYNLLLSIRNK